MTPNVARTDSEFITTALIGTSTDRKTIASIAAVTPRISPMISGRRASSRR